MPAKYSQRFRLYTLVALSRLLGLPRRWRQWRRQSPEQRGQALVGPRMLAS